MSKRIIIIGAGISGLSLLHYLNKRYAGRDDVRIRLLEKNDSLGGTIRCERRNGCLFEAGPNGFLDSKPRTLELIDELNLRGRLVRADEQAKIRYVALGRNLHAIPAGLKSFLFFKPLTLLDKLRVAVEPLVPRGADENESVYDFGRRRLGGRFADIFLDAMVGGIYGGDARQISLKAAFPRMHALENEHGSLFQAMRKLRRNPKAGQSGGAGLPQGTLTSFRDGLSQWTEALGARYRENIELNRAVTDVSLDRGRYGVHCGAARQDADQLFICTPAYGAAAILKNISAPAAEILNSIDYAPMAVIGLVFARAAFKAVPRGFGYLIPSSQKSEVLGVLFDHNIFPGRCAGDQAMLRIMAGGARHPGVLNKSRDELLALALREIRSKFDVQGPPQDIFWAIWPRAIPQYGLDHPDKMRRLEKALSGFENLYLTANYRGGVSMNDCVENACRVAGEGPAREPERKMI